MSDKPTIVLADDHPPTREGLRVILQESGWEVLAMAADAGDAVALTLEHLPDVCLLDVNMPGSGVTACDEICRRAPRTAVVMLTVSAEASDLLDALKVGARGYLLKDIAPDRLGAALRDVLRGEAALPRSLTARLIEEFRGREQRSRFRSLRKRGAELTEKEWEVLELMREGRTTAQMAEGLSVSPVTVRTHVSAIMRKLKVGSRDEAVRVLDEEEQ